MNINPVSQNISFKGIIIGKSTNSEGKEIRVGVNTDDIVDFRYLNPCQNAAKKDLIVCNMRQPEGAEQNRFVTLNSDLKSFLRAYNAVAGKDKIQEVPGRQHIK